MKCIRIPVVALAALITSLSVKAQTVDEIINKHIDAIGGKDKISGMKSIVIEADLDIAGNQGTSTTSVLYGKGSLLEIDLGGQKIATCITDQGGWAMNPLAGQTSAEPLPADQANLGKVQLAVGGPLFDYAARGNKVELAGQEDAGGVKAWKLKVTTKEGANLTYYIDPATWYIVKAVTQLGQGGEQVTTYSDYKKTDYGYVAAYSSARELPGGITVNITVRKIDVNKEVDPKIFNKP